MAKQNEFQFYDVRPRSDDEVRADALNLYWMWKSGRLGGEQMPEDVHPNLDNSSSMLLHYFTLGMCLNYQRNSYKLWEACTAAYNQSSARWVFEPKSVVSRSVDDLRDILVSNKVALQPNKHVQNWWRVSAGIVDHGKGEMNSILRDCNYDIASIREFIQSNKKSFPYLGGDKICNYWLYVLTQYTGFPLTNRNALSVAPDTHVMNASKRLGLVPDEAESSGSPTSCARAWERVLKKTNLVPIDIHTPLWLWSRMNFPPIESTSH